jgi:hypothetical protein
MSYGRYCVRFFPYVFVIKQAPFNLVPILSGSVLLVLFNSHKTT